MSDFFQYASGKKQKKGEIIRKVENPILYSDTSPDLYFLTDKLLSKSQINILRKMLSKYLPGEPSIRVLYTYTTHKDLDSIERSIIAHVIDNSIDLSQHIPPNSKVVTFGRALYSITRDTNIQLASFQDIIWNDTKFYDPRTKSWIFPVAWMFAFYDFDSSRLKDNYDLYHFKHQLKYASSFNPPRLRIPKIKTEIVANPNRFLHDHMEEKTVAWDLETGGFDCARDEIRCITMSFDGIHGYYMRWKDVDTALLEKFLDGKYQIGANLKFDCRFLWYRGVKTAMPDFDTLHAGHVLNELRSNSLKTHSWIYTYHGGYEYPLDEYKRKYPKTKNYLLIPESIMADYAAKDAIIVYQVWKEMQKHLAKDHVLEKYFYEHVMPTVRMFVEIESHGAHINWENVRAQGEKLRERKTEIEQEIYKEAGFKFNISSTKELAKVLEFDLNLPFLGERTKAGTFYTNEEHLAEWAKSGYKIAELLLEYRGYNSFLNMFVGSESQRTAYWEYRSPDGRIFPRFSVMLANSHRNRANSPNLQQVPHHGDKAWRIRSFFDVPSKDYYISEFDYSGLQLRIAAILSGDENMKDVFVNQGGDLHSMTARSIFTPDMELKDFLKLKKEDPYEGYRFKAKGANFGFLFGMAAITYTASYIRKEWEVDQCKDLIKKQGLDLLYDKETGRPDYHLTVGQYMRDAFFGTYSGLEALHESLEQFARREGYVRSYHGARRLLPQFLHIGNDRKTESSLKNIARNTTVQNFEIVMISRAMREIHQYLKNNNMKSRMWATVHDAIAFYIHKDEFEELKIKIPEIMEKVYPEYGEIPIEVEGDVADPNAEEPSYWGYGKPLD